MTKIEWVERWMDRQEKTKKAISCFSWVLHWQMAGDELPSYAMQELLRLGRELFRS